MKHRERQLQAVKWALTALAVLLSAVWIASPFVSIGWRSEIVRLSIFGGSAEILWFDANGPNAGVRGWHVARAPSAIHW